MFVIGRLVSGPKDTELLAASPKLVISGAECSDDGMKKYNGRSEDSDGEAIDERGEKSDGVKEEGRTDATSLKCLNGSSVLTGIPLAVTGLRLGNRSDWVAVDSSTYVSCGPEPE